MFRENDIRELGGKQHESPEALDGCDSLRSSLRCGAYVVSLAERLAPFSPAPRCIPGRAGLKGAASYANPGDASTGLSVAREARSESRERSWLGLSCCLQPLLI